MQNKYYINDWKKSTKEDILNDFQFSGDRTKIEILFASYINECYNGEAFLIVEKDNNLYEVNAYHCSCYGLEDQFKLEETSLKQLEFYLENGEKFSYFSGHAFLKEQLKDFIKHYKELKK